MNLKNLFSNRKVSFSKIFKREAGQIAFSKDQLSKYFPGDYPPEQIKIEVEVLLADNEEARRAKKIEMMEKCFDCYAENGLTSVGVKAIADACGCNVASLYQYFDNLDDLIIQATEYCMSKVEDDFMAKAPTDVEDLWRFIDEIPYWTAEKHGKKYRLMYQIYAHPKYRQYGQKFFAGVDKRYTEYAKSLEGKLGIPYEKLTPLIFILIRACVHYALFEDEFYLKSQIEVLKETLELFIMKYNPKARSGAVTE